ncbi:MAG: DUF2851 domain-containing protein [Bacteroidetes bacterium]|nr:MAG: DUF2851 domain-containing protein [Bacteroidota bacterium]
MQEDFLHYLWKHKKLDVLNLVTTNFESVEILSVGQHNQNSGPDFFNAKLRIADQLWAGNVEIHLKSSDWFIHNHETDKAYDNVILHIVWEHDTDVFRKDNSKLPTLVLKDFVAETAIMNYKNLTNNSKKWINCESDFGEVDDFIIQNWLERLYLERLEKKSVVIEELLKKSNNNWEAVLFKLLAKNFGLNVNGDAFFSLANSIDFSIIRKLHSNEKQLEALLFGQADLLNDTIEEPYYSYLQKEYAFLKQKFEITNQGVLPFKFFRLRPMNFPTIRISQLAMLYHVHHNFFSELINLNSLKEFHQLFSITTSEFWNSHYTFNKSSKFSKKTISKSFIDLLLINTIIPIKYCYEKYNGKDNHENILKLIQGIKPEKNSIVDKFESLKPVSNSALQSQALLELKSTYCDKNKCLQCAIGNTVLSF